MRSNFGGKDELVGSAEMSIPLHLGQGENSEGHWVDLRSHAPAAKILLRSFLIEPARLQNQDDEEAKPAAPTIDTTPAPHGGGRRKFSVMDSPNSVANKMQGLRFLLITIHRCTCVNVVHTFLAQSPYVIGRVLPSRASVARTECCVGGGADPFWDTVVAAEPASRGFRGGTTNVLALRVVKGMTSIELQVSYITPLQLHQRFLLTLLAQVWSSQLVPKLIGIGSIDLTGMYFRLREPQELLLDRGGTITVSVDATPGAQQVSP